MSFIQNTHLQGSPCGAAHQKRGRLVAQWSYESKSLWSAVAERDDTSGALILRLNGSSPWFRLCHDITLPLEEGDYSYRAEIELAGIEGQSGLTLDSIRLLEIDPEGKHIAISDSRDAPQHISCEMSGVFTRIIVPRSRQAQRPTVLAVQFSGGPGAVSIRRIAFTRLRAEPAAAPCRPAPLRLNCDGHVLTAQLALPEAENEVLVFIDGKPLAPAPVPVPPLRLLRFELPPDIPRGRTYSVSVRRTDGVRLAKPAQVRLDHSDNMGAPSRTAALPHAKRRRVAVVSWDMGHNPAGRAYMLAEMASRHNDVQIVGPLFPAYGGKVWEPIAQSPIPIETFPAPDFASFISGALDAAKRIRCDAVYVAKPRLPGLILGALIKQANRCPMILDIDDHELSFFRERSMATLADVAAALSAEPGILDKPYGEIFTRYAEGLTGACDCVTVSNYALKQRFGGIVVRHGRDETQFDPDLHDREHIRTEFGYSLQDRVIVFLGTPREHKGVFDLADALESLGDDRLALCVIGSTNDRRIDARFAQYKRARISQYPFQPWSRIAEIVNMADAIFLLQDPESPVSEYQIPAKLTDGLAMGVPVYATPVPPLRDLIAAGAVIPVGTEAEIKAALQALAEKGRDASVAARARGFFLSELSNAANGARIETAIAQAESANRKASPAFDRLFEVIEKAGGVTLPRFTPPWSGPAVWRHRPPDVVFFWKQNDSDLYGRRSDMIVKYLIETGAVRRVIHFDAPLRAQKLEELGRIPTASANQGWLVHQAALRRFRKQADSASVARRTFIYSDRECPMALDGAELPPLEGFPDFVAQTLAELSVCGSPLMWVCPAISGYAALKRAVTPRGVVADIIDDQRTLTMKESSRRRLIRDYEDILSDADVVLANCQPVRDAFSDLRSDIHVVPNGAEIFDTSVAWEVPEQIARLPRPIIGYVGNLRDRVDTQLIRKVAQAHPGGSVVLIGSAHGDADVLSLADQHNVHFLGVIPYPESIRFIRAFDVAIVPHLRNVVSERMNPLKLYVYFALGTPIVTTDVANIHDIRPFASVASSHEDFIAAVGNVLRGGAARPEGSARETIINRISWTSRIREIASIIGLGAG